MWKLIAFSLLAGQPVLSPPPSDGADLPPPRPLDRANWIGSDDYPIEAVARNAEGSVTFVLQVDQQGGVTDCEIENSSGDAALDEATCSLLSRRARFASGRHRGRYRGSVNWTLPSGLDLPFTTMRTLVAFTVTQDGARDCTYQTGEFQHASFPVVDCRLIGAELRRAGVSGFLTGARIILRSTVLPEGASSIEDLTASGQPVFHAEITFEVLESGALSNCQLVEAQPYAAATSLGDPCHLFWALGLNDAFMPGNTVRRGRLKGDVLIAGN